MVTAKSEKTLRSAVQKIWNPLKSFLRSDKRAGFGKPNKDDTSYGGFAPLSGIDLGFHVYGLFPSPEGGGEWMVGAGNPSTGEGAIFISFQGAWERIPLPKETALVSRVIRLDENTYVAGGMSTIGRGVLLRSVDRGRNWKKIRLSLENFSAIESMIRLDDHQILASAGKMLSQGKTRPILLRSNDQGQTWEQEEIYLPVRMVQSMVMDRDHHLYVGTHGDQNPRAYVSTDRAKSWNELPAFPEYKSYKMPWVGHYFDHQKRRRLLVLLWGYKMDLAERVVRLYTLEDEQAQWRELPPLPEVNFVFSFLVDSHGDFWAGAEKGRVFRSTDRGNTWDLAADFKTHVGAYSLFENPEGALALGKDFVYPDHASLWVRK